MVPKKRPDVDVEQKRKAVREALNRSLPDVVPRNGLKKKYGIPYSDGYLANCDSMGTGPGVIRIGARACYIKDPLIDWVVERVG